MFSRTKIDSKVFSGDAAKSTTGLVSFNKRCYWESLPARNTKKLEKPKKRGVLVDVVAEDGEQWLKVSTVTEKRLLFELAKQGWEAADSSSSSDSERAGILSSNGTNGFTALAFDDFDTKAEENDDEKIELIRLAQDLRKASLASRVRYKHPHVHFILPYITPHKIPEIDHILFAIHSTGATTGCGPFLASSPTPLSELFPRLLRSTARHTSPTLNIDCTILLALVSDLSHYNSATIPLEAASGAKDGQPHPASVRQLQMESEEQLLPSILYPLLQGREMICTTEAARRMREIVSTIGTDSEKARTEIFISPSVSSPRASSDLQSSLNSLTHHPIPSNLHLPISVVPSAVDLARLPAIAANIAVQLSEVNRSVFLHGWQEGYTTISSNRAVVKGVESVFEEQRSEEVGPDVWLVGTARSLVGKEKGRG